MGKFSLTVGEPAMPPIIVTTQDGSIGLRQGMSAVPADTEYDYVFLEPEVVDDLILALMQARRHIAKGTVK